MFAVSQSSHTAYGTLAVCDGGLGNGQDVFRSPPKGGYSRKDLAALIAQHPGNIKRLEGKTPALAKGRRTLNQRVLRYAAEVVVEFLTSTDYRVDLRAAIRLGFPISALPADRFGRGTTDGALVPLKAAEVRPQQARWDAWRTAARAKAPKAGQPESQSPALDGATIAALLAVVEARPPKSRLAEVATTVGRSSAQIEGLVATAAARLRDQLQTLSGQLLFAVLLAPSVGASSAAAEETEIHT